MLISLSYNLPYGGLLCGTYENGGFVLTCGNLSITSDGYLNYDFAVYTNSHIQQIQIPLPPGNLTATIGNNKSSFRNHVYLYKYELMET